MLITRYTLLRNSLTYASPKKYFISNAIDSFEIYFSAFRNFTNSLNSSENYDSRWYVQDVDLV